MGRCKNREIHTVVDMEAEDPRFIAVKLLRVLRKHYTYRELEEYFNIPAPSIWKYITGKVLPTPEKAREILDTIVAKKMVSQLIKRLIKTVDGGIIDLSDIIYDVGILKLIGLEAYYYFAEQKPSIIVSIEVDGIPVALSVAEYFNAKIVIVKKRPEASLREYIEYSFISRDLPVITKLYAPREPFTRRDRVLIVDDLLRTGRTCRALIEMVKNTPSKPIGVFSILAVGNGWVPVLEETGLKVHIVYWYKQ